MIEYRVTEVIDGDSFKVKNGWIWEGKKGDTIRPTGYNTPEKSTLHYSIMKSRLTKLILNKTVEIGKVIKIDPYGRLLADVFYENKNLADYFPEYKIK